MPRSHAGPLAPAHTSQSSGKLLSYKYMQGLEISMLITDFPLCYWGGILRLAHFNHWSYPADEGRNIE